MAKDQHRELIRKRAQQIRDAASEAWYFLEHQLRNLNDTIDSCAKTIEWINSTGGGYPNHRREFLPIFLSIPEDVQARLYPCILNAVVCGGNFGLEAERYKQIEQSYASAIKLSRSSRRNVSVRFADCANTFSQYASAVRGIASEIHQGIISSKKGSGSSAARRRH